MPRGTKRSGEPAGARAKCHKVETALIDSELLPESVRRMLGGMMSRALIAYKEERHSYQNSIVAMVDESMTSVQQSMQSNITTAQATVDDSENERARRTQEQISAEASLTAAKESVAAARAAAAAAKDAEKGASLGVSEALVAQKSGDASLVQLAEDKASLEALLTGDYEQLKNGSMDAAKKFFKELNAVGKKNVISFESHMMDAIPTALKSKPEKRTAFDGVVLKYFEDVTAAKLGELSKAIEDGAPGRTERAGAVAAAEAKLEEAAAAHVAAKEKLAEAEKMQKEAQKALQHATKEVQNFLPYLEGIADALDEAKVKLQHFEEGPLALMAELKELAPAPEPEPEEEQPEVAAEPVATEAMATETIAAEPGATSVDIS